MAIVCCCVGATDEDVRKGTDKGRAAGQQCGGCRVKQPQCEWCGVRGNPLVGTLLGFAVCEVCQREWVYYDHTLRSWRLTTNPAGLEEVHSMVQTAHAFGIKPYEAAEYTITDAEPEHVHIMGDMHASTFGDPEREVPTITELRELVGRCNADTRNANRRRRWRTEYRPGEVREVAVCSAFNQSEGLCQCPACEAWRHTDGTKTGRIEWTEGTAEEFVG